MALLRSAWIVVAGLGLAFPAMAQTEMASLQQHALMWQRTSPSEQQLDGPVLYTIIIRSSATPNNIPKISNNYTLTNSLISDDGTTVMIGGANGLLLNGSSGIITFAPGQTLPGGPFLPLTGGVLSGNLNGVNASFTDNVTAGGIFSGNGSGLTNVNAAQLGGLAASAYQQRVGGVCSPGGSVVAVNADGTVVCAAVNPSLYSRAANLRTVVDSTGNPGGGATSLTIGTDGLPIISYEGSGNFNLSVVHCTAVDCSTHGTPTVLDNTTNAGVNSSITIGSDGLPIISYAGCCSGPGINLSVVHCTAVDCSTHGAVTVLDSTPGSGSSSSITVGSDGLPVVSYQGSNASFVSNLSVVHCTAVDCSTHGAATVLDSTASAGGGTSVTIGSDGLPIISYNGNSGGSNGNLSVVHCTALDCSTHGAVTLLDNTSGAIFSTSVTVGSDGLPIIGYSVTFIFALNGNLSAVHCTAVDCSTHGTATVLDSTPLAGAGASVIIGTDGLPVISYTGTNSGNRNLNVVHCTTADCSAHGPLTVLDNTPNTGGRTSVTIGTDGLPIISYRGQSGNPNLSVMHCANILCAPPFVRRR